MSLAQQLGPLVLKMAGHARSVTLAQAALTYLERMRSPGVRSHTAAA